MASIVATTLIIGLVAAPQDFRTARVPTIDEITQVLNAYASGNDLAVAEWARSIRMRQTRDLEEVLRRSDVSTRLKAAFVIELVAAAREPFFSIRGLLPVGRTVLDGAAPLGDDPSTDRFEVLWHQIAIAAAQGAEQFSIQRNHLEAIRGRFENARRRNVEPPSRLKLAEAMAAVGLCCLPSLPGPSHQIVSNWRPDEKTTADGALLLFKQAATIPALQIEAQIRGGVLLYGIGREEQAIEWLDRVPAHNDATLGYVQHLTRGLAFDELRRFADAAAAYRRATEYVPTAQSAPIGLAAALLRSGDVDAAAKVAAESKRMFLVSSIADPRFVFRHGDLRFVPEWIAELRRLIR